MRALQWEELCRIPARHWTTTPLTWADAALGNSAPPEGCGPEPTA
jgi:hypothetical protein